MDHYFTNIQRRIYIPILSTLQSKNVNFNGAGDSFCAGFIAKSLKNGRVDNFRKKVAFYIDENCIKEGLTAAIHKATIDSE